MPAPRGRQASIYIGGGEMNDVSLTAARLVSPVAFAGRPGFFKLLLKNAVLTLLTLGIYRFWARTAMRRYLWNNVLIAGEPLEYTGRGIELFIGFLIATAILFPFFLIYSVLQQFLLTNPLALGALLTVYILCIIVLTQIAIYRSRRYRLTRTRWRGISCGQDGSVWRYVAISLGWSAIWLLTLGLAEPWAQMALRRYELKHTVFGDRRFGFDGCGSGLFLRWLVVYASFVAPLLVFVLMNIDVWQELSDIVDSPPEERREAWVALYHGISGWWLPVVGVPAGILAFYWYSVRQIRYVVAAVNFGDIRFHSAAKARVFVLNFLGLAGSMFIYILLVFALLIGFAVLALGLGAMVRGGLPPEMPGEAMFVGIGVGVAFWLALYFGHYVLSSMWLTYRNLGHLCQTLTIENLASVESVLQAAQREPRYGEGLADAFDVGAI